MKKDTQQTWSCDLNCKKKKKKICNLTTFALFRCLQIYNLHDCKATMHSSETGFPKSFEFIK